jgi:hypothetical protein
VRTYKAVKHAVLLGFSFQLDCLYFQMLETQEISIMLQTPLIGRWPRHVPTFVYNRLPLNFQRGFSAVRKIIRLVQLHNFRLCSLSLNPLLRVLNIKKKFIINLKLQLHVPDVHLNRLYLGSNIGPTAISIRHVLLCCTERNKVNCSLLLFYEIPRC